MRDDMRFGRRGFIQLSAAGAAALVFKGNLVGCADPLGQGSQDTGTPPGSTPFSPTGIPALRVVYSSDPGMLTGTPSTWDYDSQNRYVDAVQVGESLDRMAMALSGQSTSQEAWRAIFLKPDTKNWSEVKAGIKVNTVYASCIPRHAVLAKICTVLIDELGMAGHNICIYDCDKTAHAGHAAGVAATYAANTASYPFPAGVLINANLFSGDVSSVEVAGGAISPVTCLKDLVDGTVDILVNVAVNKGHYQAGNVTLCQKNNIGAVKFFCPGKTVAVGQGVYTEGSAQDLVAINQCEALVGGNPPRQQLCILDSLWAMKQGPAGGGITHQPGVLAMGIHPGAVDYLAEKKIRDEMMGCPSTRQDDINTFITGYGFTDSERRQLTELDPADNHGKGWVDARA
ncbi:MAG: DUF362 domain-containing protein [Pseudomonadota bacterium]